MDDLERLQNMFPTVEADVVAIIFREFGYDGELIGVELLESFKPLINHYYSHCINYCWLLARYLIM